MCRTQHFLNALAYQEQGRESGRQNVIGAQPGDLMKRRQGLYLASQRGKWIEWMRWIDSNHAASIGRSHEIERLPIEVVRSRS